LNNRRRLTSEKSIIPSIAIAMYADEPCRICGVILTLNDIFDGAVFAGYSKNNEARAAHKKCWDKNLPMSEWKFQ